MALAFDLISDLHVDQWSVPFDWSGQPTSPFCLVVGDVARDRALLIQTLRHLADCYKGVFYIDGNGEHAYNYHGLADSYKDLTTQLNAIPNLVYLQNNVVVINGVAILGTNGWWTWDLDPAWSVEQTQSEWIQKHNFDQDICDTISVLAQEDSGYLSRSIKRLQKHYDVRHIVIATHTVPGRRFIQHDIDFADNLAINYMGNSTIAEALKNDQQGKVHTWCFGHYHGKVNRVENRVRYVNNCRGKEKTRTAQSVFLPLRLVIDD